MQKKFTMKINIFAIIPGFFNRSKMQIIHKYIFKKLLIVKATRAAAVSMFRMQKQ